MTQDPITDIPDQAERRVRSSGLASRRIQAPAATGIWQRVVPAWLKYALLAFVVSRVLVFGAGLIADRMLPVESNHWQADTDSRFLRIWAKWDSQYYLDIAANGYWFTPGEQSNVAFFPLYPLLIRLFAPSFGNDAVLTGFVISNLAFLVGLIFLYVLTELEIDAAAAQRAVFYLAVFPTAFFFSALYTESLFVALALATVYFARKRSWLLAALLGMLAAATRNLGVVLWLFVMWAWLRAQGWRVRDVFQLNAWRDLRTGIWHRWIELGIIALIPLGLLAYIYFLNRNFGQPLAFIQVQAAWGRQNIGPVAVLRNALQLLLIGDVNRGWLTVFLNLVAFMGFIAAVPAVWRRLGGGYAAVVLICLLVPATSSLGSIIRYVLPLFPVLMMLAAWGRREWLDRVVVGGFALGLGLFTAIFASWIFVA